MSLWTPKALDSFRKLLQILVEHKALGLTHFQNHALKHPMLLSDLTAE